MSEEKVSDVWVIYRDNKSEKLDAKFIARMNKKLAAIHVKAEEGDVTIITVIQADNWGGNDSE